MQEHYFEPDERILDFIHEANEREEKIKFELQLLHEDSLCHSNKAFINSQENCTSELSVTLNNGVQMDDDLIDEDTLILEEDFTRPNDDRNCGVVAAVSKGAPKKRACKNCK